MINVSKFCSFTKLAVVTNDDMAKKLAIASKFASSEINDGATAREKLRLSTSGH